MAVEYRVAARADKLSALTTTRVAKWAFRTPNCQNCSTKSHRPMLRVGAMDYLDLWSLDGRLDRIHHALNI